MNALVTGGAGFIGSHLCDRLLNDGAEVTVIDNLSTGSLDNIAHLNSEPGFRFIHGDILDEDSIARAIDGCNVVFHLAASVGVKYIVENPLQSIRCNVHGTDSVLRAALSHGSPVVLASSSEVYGKNPNVPFSEDHDLVLGATTRPRWSYACGKAINEFMALSYSREKNLPVVVARLFNVCGPRQTGRYGMVIPSFVRNALQGRPLQVFGSGRQTRCFAYVGDVVDALCRLGTQTSAIGEVFNIGNSQEISINELACLIVELSESKSPIRHVSYEQAYGCDFEDMHRRVPDIGKIHRLLNWQPNVELRPLLKMIIDDERARLAGTTGNNEQVRSV